MNVSSTPSANPPLSISGTVSSARPVRPLDPKGGTPALRPLPPVDNGRPAEPTRPPVRPGEGRGGDAPPALPPAPADMFNVQGLLDDWGKSDSPYDLDGNGDVDAWDLALFLGGERPKSGEPTYNIQGLLEHWGQSDSPYDLDGNGTVDAWDLALFQGGQRPEDPTPLPPANDPTNNAGGTTATATAMESTRPGPEDGQAFLDRFTRFVFRSSIGRAGDIAVSDMKLTSEQAAQLDPDGDGLVKRAALKKFIQDDIAGRISGDDGFKPRLAAREWIDRLGGPTANEELVSFAGRGAREELVSRPGQPVGDASRREAALARLSSFVTGKFENAGFREHPPRNLHAVVNQFNLPAADRTSLLEQLAARYPNGLGINRIG